MPAGATTSAVQQSAHSATGSAGGEIPGESRMQVESGGADKRTVELAPRPRTCGLIRRTVIERRTGAASPLSADGEAPGERWSLSYGPIRQDPPASRDQRRDDDRGPARESATNLRTPRATNSTTPKSRMRRESPLRRHAGTISPVGTLAGRVSPGPTFCDPPSRCSIDAFDRALMIGSSLRMNVLDPTGRGLTSRAALPRLADDFDPATPATDSCRGRRAARQRNPARPRRPRP